MGFLDFLFTKNYKTGDIVYPKHEYTIKYSDKGISRSNSKKSPWRAYLSLTKKFGSKAKTVQFHIGYFTTKEEAQKARYNFIQSLV